MAKYLLHLKYFEITKCNCLEEIIFWEDIEEETQATMTLSLLPQLQSLELKDLQHLSGFCFSSQNKVIEFPFMKSMTIYHCPNMEGFICRYAREGNQQISSQGCISQTTTIETLRVEGCDKLLTIFPSNMLTTFQRLQRLIVKTCGSLQQEIVSKLEEGSDSETAINFEFDQLCTLSLWLVPELKCFYPGKHTAKWPKLNKLEVVQCEKMKIFGTQLNTNNGQLDSPIHLPLFLVEKDIPKLQYLTLDSFLIAMISDDQFSSSLFHEVKALEVVAHVPKSIDFRISFLESFYTFENLAIHGHEIKELFCTGRDTGNEEMYVGTLSTARHTTFDRVTIACVFSQGTGNETSNDVGAEEEDPLEPNCEASGTPVGEVSGTSAGRQQVVDGVSDGGSDSARTIF
ncbi:hypothetical protein GOBAR_AA13114 [Gossypium barbadense]|uniref:Disease resistance protein At4g27190-like leucine-rich repeats domain-containing protein n=1 Tax=Gossypium barbadense TaxID=3634 RepID=A0A2P5XW07_GOSBA|nr:hypothetical protein GOBAR_AA13114 [Gossypium barbadense]